MKKCKLAIAMGIGLNLAFAPVHLGCGGTKQQETGDPPPPPPPPPPPNNDKYDEYKALVNSLLPVFEGISGQNLTEQQQKEKSDLVKEAFADGFSRDKISKDIPFSSDELRNAYSLLEYQFPYSYITGGGFNGILLGTLHNPDGLTHAAVHETGHAWGLGESLASLLNAKYRDDDLSVTNPAASVGNLQYSPFYDNLLLERVGAEKFWKTIWRSTQPQAEYGKMWDDNMTVTVNGGKTTLASFKDFQTARALSACEHNAFDDPNWEDIARGFEQFSGIRDIAGEFRKMGPVFENALRNNNSAAIEQVQSFIGLIKDYSEIEKRLWQEQAIDDFVVRIFTGAMTANKTQQNQRDQDDEMLK